MTDYFLIVDFSLIHPQSLWLLDIILVFTFYVKPCKLYLQFKLNSKTIILCVLLLYFFNWQSKIFILNIFLLHNYINHYLLRVLEYYYFKRSFWKRVVLRERTKSPMNFCAIETRINEIKKYQLPLVRKFVMFVILNSWESIASCETQKDTKRLWIFTVLKLKYITRESPIVVLTGANSRTNLSFSVK